MPCRIFVRYHPNVPSILIRSRLGPALGILGLAALGVQAASPPEAGTADAFYTVTGEIALARQEPRLAALQYSAGARRDPKLLPRAVEVAAQTLQPAIGLDLAEHWITFQPQIPESHLAAATAALALHRIDAAAAHYRAYLTRVAGGTEAGFAVLEHELLDNANIYGARQVADRLSAAYPRVLPALRLQGLAALRADDPASAVRALQAAIAAAAGTPDVHALIQPLRRARILAGDLQTPLAEARAELSADNDAAQRIDYALLLVAAKRKLEAREELGSLLGTPDAAPQALRLLGVIEFQDGDDGAALDHFQQLAATGQFADDAWFYQGLIAVRHADPDRALGAFARVRGGDNGLPAMLQAAAILRRHGEAAESDELYRQLLADEPGSAPEILAAHAALDLEAGDAATAAARISAALAQYPDSIELHYARATLYEEQGDISAALRELDALLKSRPQDPAAENALGYTLADHARQLSRARTLIDKAERSAPRSAAIRDSLGWVLFRQGRTGEARVILSAAFADEPGADIGAHLGEVLWTLGQQDEAEKIWAHAGMLDLDNRLLKATRQRLRRSRTTQ